MALVNTGRNYMANALIANPTTLFDVTNATIGVGTSSTAYAATQTDLLGTKAYSVVDSAPTIATNVLTFVATFGTSEANFAWNEWGVFNSAGVAPTGGDIMLNRKVESLGTKTSAQSWEITATLTVAIGT
jgi:hypothetical protein